MVRDKNYKFPFRLIIKSLLSINLVSLSSVVKCKCAKRLIQVIFNSSIPIDIILGFYNVRIHNGDLLKMYNMFCDFFFLLHNQKH